MGEKRPMWVSKCTHTRMRHRARGSGGGVWFAARAHKRSATPQVSCYSSRFTWTRKRASRSSWGQARTLAQQSGCHTLATDGIVQSSSLEPPPLPHSQSLVGAWGRQVSVSPREHASKQGTDQRPTCVWGLSPLRASAAATASASPDSVMYRTPDELTRTPRGSPLPLRRREDLGVPSTPAAQVTPPVPCISLGRRPRLGLPVGKGRGVALACAMKRPTRDRSSHTTGSSGRRRG